MVDHYGTGVILFRWFTTAVAISGGTIALLLLGIWEDVRGTAVGLVAAVVVSVAAFAVDAMRLWIVAVPLVFLAGLYAVALGRPPEQRRRRRTFPLTILIGLGALVAAGLGVIVAWDHFLIADHHAHSTPSTLDEYLTVAALGGVQTVVGAGVLARLGYCCFVVDGSDASSGDAGDTS